MSLENGLRYEIIGSNPQLQTALKNQQERIQNDESMADKAALVKSDKLTSLRSEWIEGLAKAAEYQQAKHEAKRSKEEYQQINNTSNNMRKAQLKCLLEAEYKTYEQELNNQGKTFYIKRT